MCLTSVPQQPPRMVRCGKRDRRSTCSRPKASRCCTSFSPPVSCSSPPWAVAEATDLPMRDVRRPRPRPGPAAPAAAMSGRQCRGGNVGAAIRSGRRRRWCGGLGALGEQRPDLRFPEPAVPAGSADGPDPSVGCPPGHCLGVHPEHLRDLVRGEQTFGVLIGHVAHLSPGRLVHNGHVRPYCTYNLPHSKSHLRSDNHLRTASAHLCSSLRRVACRSAIQVAPVGGSNRRQLPAAERAAPTSGVGVARRLLIASVVIVRCRPRNPVTATLGGRRIGREQTR
jgi:hypothetical protein